MVQAVWCACEGVMCLFHRDMDDDDMEVPGQAPPVTRGTYPRDFGRQRKGTADSVQPEALV